MNRVERIVRKADRAQQRYIAPAFIFGVSKKFGDDNGGILVAGQVPLIGHQLSTPWTLAEISPPAHEKAG